MKLCQQVLANEIGFSWLWVGWRIFSDVLESKLTRAGSPMKDGMVGLTQMEDQRWGRSVLGMVAGLMQMEGQWWSGQCWAGYLDWYRWRASGGGGKCWAGWLDWSKWRASDGGSQSWSRMAGLMQMEDQWWGGQCWVGWLDWCRWRTSDGGGQSWGRTDGTVRVRLMCSLPNKGYETGAEWERWSQHIPFPAACGFSVSESPVSLPRLPWWVKCRKVGKAFTKHSPSSQYLLQENLDVFLSTRLGETW